MLNHITPFNANPSARDPSSLAEWVPFAPDLEEGILGSIILEPESHPSKRVVPLLKPRYFHLEANRMVCESIIWLAEHDAPVDLLSVSEQLQKTEQFDQKSGSLYLCRLINRVSSSANVEYWFRLLYQKYIQREIILAGYSSISQAIGSSVDVFDLLEQSIARLSQLRPMESAATVSTSLRLGDSLLKELQHLDNPGSEEGLLDGKSYPIGWTRFDEVVTLAGDKIILIAGAASSGKSRFIRSIIFRLVERYRDISVCWITLEDSREDILRSYLASQAFITAKHLKHGHFDREKISHLVDFTKQFQKFDIEFIDEAIRSQAVVTHFIRFCDQRKDRFNILVIDNILSLDDQQEFRFDPNGFSNHVMHNLLKCRQKTKGLIIPLHHFNDAQQDKQNIKTGYRPVLKDLKGSETFRRTPNQILLINSFNIYKDLMSEYSGTEHEILKHLFIVDTGKNREDRIDDASSLIHFLVEMAYDQFYEVPPENTICTTTI